MTASEVYRSVATNINWDKEPKESKEDVSIESLDGILTEDVEVVEYPVDKKGRPIPPPPAMPQLVRRKKKK